MSCHVHLLITECAVVACDAFYVLFYSLTKVFAELFFRVLQSRRLHHRSRDAAGKSRSFAFLTFDDPASVNVAMMLEHFWKEAPSVYRHLSISQSL